MPVRQGGERALALGGVIGPAAFITAKGRAVALVQRGGVAIVTAFNTLGVARALDSGSPDAILAPSLTLTGNLASWVNAGVARSASITPG